VRVGCTIGEAVTMHVTMQQAVLRKLLVPCMQR
jgi:hypothetical protein